MSVRKNNLKKEEMMEEILKGILDEIFPDSKVGRSKKLQREVLKYMWEERETKGWKAIPTSNIIGHLKNKKLIKRRGREKNTNFEERCKENLRKCIESINEALNKSDVYRVQYRIVYGSKECRFLKGLSEVNAWVEKKREREKRSAGKTVKIKAPRKGLIPVITSEALSEIEKLKKIEKKIDVY